MKKQLINLFALTVITLTGLTSCKKEYDTPPVNTIPVGKKIQSINTLLKMHQGTAIKFTEDYSIYGVVTIDENNGNMYKNIYIQDNPKDVTNPDSIRGLNVRLLFSGGLYQGDYIRINLKNTVLSTYNGVYQLDSVDVDKNIVKQETNVKIEPVTISISEAQANIDKYSGRLVKFNDVEFATSELGKTYANAISQSTENRILQDCNVNQILVRTSGYSNFAATSLPVGKGSITAVLSRFNEDIQLYLRTPNEAQLTGVRCDGSVFVEPILSKNFEDNNINSGGWLVKQVSGTSAWASSIFSNNYFAKASSFGSGDANCETWLISPAINLSGTIDPVFNFKNAANFSGPDMEVFISTNYDGSSAPSSATWTSVTYTKSAGGFAWANSGDITLAPYKVSNVRIAFKYTGTSTTAKTWEVDDILVKEK